MKYAFAAACDTQARRGKRTDGSLKEEAWAPVCDAIQPYCTNGYKIKLAQVKAYWHQWKLYFKNYAIVRDFSGMGWNDAQQMFSAHDDVWRALETAHPKLKS